MWRLVVKRVATLQGLETHWSIDDIFDANDAIDAIEAAEAKANKAASR